MRKKILFTTMIFLVVAACTIFISDGLTYLVTFLMGLVIMSTIHRNRSRVTKMTRWAKANPKKAQVFIIVVQIALMVLGIFAGNNFKELGYEFSNTTAYVFCIIIAVSFSTINFLPKRSTIAMPIEVNRNRLAYLGITLSSFVIMVLFGNRIGDIYPNSPITHTIKAIDQAIFPDDNMLTANVNDAAIEPNYVINYKQTLTDESSAKAVFASLTISDNETIKLPTESNKTTKANLKAEKKAIRMEKKKARLMNHLKNRMAAAGGIGVGAILLIILLVLTSCAGICLIISGGGAGAVAGGVAVLGLSIFGIVKLVKGKKQKTE